MCKVWGGAENRMVYIAFQLQTKIWNRYLRYTDIICKCFFRLSFSRIVRRARPPSEHNSFVSPPLLWLYNYVTQSLLPAAQHRNHPDTLVVIVNFGPQSLVTVRRVNMYCPPWRFILSDSYKQHAQHQQPEPGARLAVLGPVVGAGEGAARGVKHRPRRAVPSPVSILQQLLLKPRSHKCI